jgi:hypothetical protein
MFGSTRGTSGGVGSLQEVAVATNRRRRRTGRRWWRTTQLGPVMAQSRIGLGHAGARARGLNKGADPEVSQARTPRTPGGGAGRGSLGLWPMGLARTGRAGAGRAFGLRPLG